METGMKNTVACRGRTLGRDRADAIAWLVNQLRWERTLDHLRSTEAGRTDKAA
jgi:hypothetical protein